MAGTSQWLAPVAGPALTQETHADTPGPHGQKGLLDGEFSVSTLLDLQMACCLVKRYSG